jgi:hypothetical protein
MKGKKFLINLVAILTTLTLSASVFAGCNPSSNTGDGDQTSTEQPDESNTNTGNNKGQDSGTAGNGTQVGTSVSYLGMKAGSSVSSLSSKAKTTSVARAITAYADTNYSQYRGEDFYINVQFSNPNNYKITKFSLTYAGEKFTYTSNNFESGSTCSNIYVKVPAEYYDAQYTDYTISDITYAEDTTVKAVKVDNNDTVRVGINDIREGYVAEAEFTLNADGTYTMTAVSDKYIKDGVLTIPQTYNDKQVTAIGNYAFTYEAIKEVIIPDSITEIGNYAFYNCKSLTKITVGSGVKHIGYMAFYGCTATNYVNYTGTIAQWMQIEFNETVEEQLANMEWGYFNTNSRYSNPVYNSRNLYFNDVLLTEVTVPDEIDRVLQCTFMRCISLNKIILHDGIKTIGYRAFDNCCGLSDIDLCSIETIDAYAFSGCWGLTNITIPSTVTKINGTGKSGGAFYAVQKLVEVYNLSDLNITAGMSGYGDVAYYADNVYNDTQTVNIQQDSDGFLWYTKQGESDNIYLIGYNGTATEIEIPYTYNDKQVIIKDCAFAGNNTIVKVTLADGFTQIPDRMFAYCRSLKTVVLPESITALGEKAFYYSTIESLVLPEACTQLGVDAFNVCDNVTITIKSKSMTFLNHAFYGIKNLTINFGGTKAEWAAIAEDDFVNAASYKGVMYNVNNYTVICSDGNYLDI